MKNKNFKKLGITLMSSVMLAGLFVPTVASADENNSQTTEQTQNTTKSENDNNDINKLQDDINNNVTIDSSGHYKYSYDTIKQIVDNYNFNEINSINGTNYTHDSFLKEATESLNNTVIPQSNFNNFAKSSKGVNKKTEGWNYTKVYRTHSKTSKVASGFNQIAINWGAIAAAGQLADWALPLDFPVAVATGSIGGINGWYFATLANSLNANNGKKGTIMTTNKFSGHYTIKHQ